MSEDRFLFRKADGTWAFYDDTYDITIHCESKEEQEKACEMLRMTGADRDKMDAMEAAKFLKKYCAGFTRDCTGCVFYPKQVDRFYCALRNENPDDWNV